MMKMTSMLLRIGSGPTFVSTVCRPRYFRAGRPLFKLQEFKLADIGEGISEVEVLKWFVSPGDKISQFEKICEVQSDKATVEITSRFDGVITKLNVETGKMAKVGEALLMIDLHSESGDEATNDSVEVQPESPSPKTPVAPPLEHSVAKNSGQKVLATPAVRRISKEHNIDLATISPTGPNGRVLKSDLLDIISKASSLPKAAAEPHPGSADIVVPISGLVRTMVKTMTSSNLVPTLTLHEEVIANELQNIRASLKMFLPTLTYLPLIIKAVSLALHDFPNLNAHVDEKCNEITLKSNHNISIAMDTPRGLLVPCIMAVQNLSVADISSELSRLTTLGAANQLGLADLQMGTFSLSNIGTIGGTYATPLIVRPQVVIGAIGRIQSGIARFDKSGNGPVNTSILGMSWSADHRVIDGATVARFSRRVKSLLESPQEMLLLTK